MTDILRHKHERPKIGTARAYESEVSKIDFSKLTRAPEVTLSNGAIGDGTCLGCYDTPCMQKVPEEFSLPAALESFPGDPIAQLCPTNALMWGTANSVVTVNPAACIGCGLCVARCPYGAIHLGEEGKAVIRTDKSKLLTDQKPKQTAKHPQPKRLGRLGSPAALGLAKLPQTAAFQLIDPNVFVRNVLHEVGVRCRSRRRGDTNIRMDAVVAFQTGRVGVVEIEFSQAALESPRALVEDIAILHSRYGLPVADVDPLSIILSLPNGRSEYYQVIDDVANVLDVKCRTLTLGVLILLMWEFVKIPDLGKELFRTQADDPDLKPSVVKLAPSLADIKEPYLGCLRNAK
jgi:ferredoxin